MLRDGRRRVSCTSRNGGGWRVCGDSAARERKRTIFASRASCTLLLAHFPASFAAAAIHQSCTPKEVKLVSD